MSSSRLPVVLRRTLTLAAVSVGAWLLLRQDGLELFRASPKVDLMTAELLRAAERADICTAANAVGVGLRGEYFYGASLAGAAGLVRIDEVVDFDQSIKWPTGDHGQPVLSVRWRGWVKAPLSGRYRFHADAPSMQILVARTLVAGVGAQPEEKVQLDAGRFYPIEVVVNRLTDSDKRIRLEWTAPHGARYVVPRALLHLPTDSLATPKG